ncbi:MAG: DNA-directed RNA polymerase subunit omega [Bacilli bacterium]|nr:DNA-directed RNA polymerase subunit omega [Bacilli bacterium]
MLYPSIDSLLKRVDSKYLLVNIVAKRAKEMEQTEHYQIKETEYKSSKNIGKALEEIKQGLIHVKEEDQL